VPITARGITSKELKPFVLTKRTLTPPLNACLPPQPRQVVTELVDGRDAALRVVVVELALPLRTPGKKRKMPRRAGSV
jgi:hypothetical protein